MSDIDPVRQPRIVVVGAGRLGCAIVRSFGDSIVGTVVRSEPSALRIQRIDPGIRIVRDLMELDVNEYDTVWIAVSDSSISGVIEEFSRLRDNWSGVTVIHSSGASPLEVLVPLATSGGVTLALHPNYFFFDDSPIPDELIWTATPTDPVSLERARRLLVPVHGTVLPLEEGQRSLYHAAASMASNHALVLFDAACAIYEAAGIPVQDARSIVERFISGSARSALRDGAGAVLTGPISRGDWDVVRGHFEALRRATPERLPLFIELCRATIDLAGKRGEEGIPLELRD